MSVSQQLKHVAIAIKGWFYANKKSNESTTHSHHKRLFITDMRDEKSQYLKKTSLSDFTIF